MTHPRTEFAFRLPKGLVDGEGNLHRDGTMRLATARDEFAALGDPDVADADDPYLTVVVLARVVTRLGTMTGLGPDQVQDLFAADVAHLQDVYDAINYGSEDEIARLTALDDVTVAPLRLASVTSEPLPPEPAPAPPAVALAAAADAPAVASSADASSADPIDEPPLVAPTPKGRRARIQEVGKSTGPR